MRPISSLSSAVRPTSSLSLTPPLQTYPSPHNRIKIPKPPLGIPFPLQPFQLLEPPRLVPIYLLQRLVAVGVVRVGVELQRAGAGDEELTGLLAVFGGGGEG